MSRDKELQVFIISVDIGSTWTKGGLFRLRDDIIYPVATLLNKTTIDDLAIGFNFVLKQLKAKAEPQNGNRHISVVYSSSAKGGLSVVAIGIVPSLTLETAKIAAYSAGARVDSYYAYELSSTDIAQLENALPDIVLLTGGTDGGNSEYVLKNATALANSNIGCPIIYAGNRCLVDQVESLLTFKELHVVDNILPQVDEQSPDAVREKIRSIFVDKIVEGKGLDTISQSLGTAPLPTPYVIHDFVGNISEHVAEWNNFMLIDLGGATTDVYSQCLETPELGVVYRGLKEPALKRTVEGDLGMRVSADSAVEKILSETELNPSRQVLNTDGIKAYVDKLKQQPEYISNCGEPAEFDSRIAECCIVNAVIRHAGRMLQVHTADGPVNVQLGRNLNHIKKIVGSGGYLSNSPKVDVVDMISQPRIDAKGRQVLLPAKGEYFRDQQYLVPLFANVARLYPKQAAKAAVAYFEIDTYPQP
ncbi:MAG: hypothetical protein ACJAYN_001677 [Bermanella sp.]|jgi:uncharacterized protein (TIGR01319 family)